MKTAGILANRKKDRQSALTQEIAAYLLEKGCSVLLDKQIETASQFARYGASREDLFQKADFLIVLGGDGTLLAAGREAARYDVPLLGINLGTLGFLTDVEKHEYKASIDKVLEGQYEVENRILLQAAVYGGGETQYFYGLNDVCITRGRIAKVIDLHVYINYEYLDTYRGDGIILATPTGSTAYNLSAGGPILKPDTRAVAVTPICPHSLNTRSIVVASSDKVTIAMGRRSRGDFLLSVDGQEGILLTQESVVRVTEAEHTCRILKTNGIGFYDRLRRKLANT